MRDRIYSSIPTQFPDHYRETNTPLIQFISSYQRWFDERNDRNLLKIGDIDQTYEQFLTSFKEKYAKTFPISRSIDTRFVIKHINDLYRTKGSEEGLRILFRLFFNEEIDVVYPSNSILKPSDSIWSEESYLEMKSVLSYENYIIQVGDSIRGDVSEASAIVDKIFFVKFGGAYTPIVYISALDGEFTSSDSLEVVRFGEPSRFPGRIISGSLISVDVIRDARLPNQSVGDRVNLKSDLSGVGATGIVTEVSSVQTGSIQFDLVDRGYGYVKSKGILDQPNANVDDVLNNEVFQSDQVMIIGETESGSQSILAEFGYGIRAINSIITPVDDTLPGPNAPRIEFQRGSVDTANNSITVVDHGFQSGVAIRYYCEGLSPIGGLVEGNLYYLIVQNSSTLQLATSLENSLNDIAIPLTSQGEDITHALQALVSYFQDEDGNYLTTVSGDATVVEINNERSLIFLKSRQIFVENNLGELVEVDRLSFPVIPDNGQAKIEITLPLNDPDDPNEIPVVFETFTTSRIAKSNTSASFEFDVDGQETIFTILDLIKDYLDVRLDAAPPDEPEGYGMSGSKEPETLETRIIDAFSIYELEIGSISDPLFITSVGTDYQNDVEVYIEQKEISNFDKRDMIVTFETTGFPIEVGDLITQEITVPDYITGDPKAYTTIARFLKRVGNKFYFRQIRFFDFQKDLPVRLKEKTLNIVNIVRDQNSFPMGINVDIDGNVEFDVGQIESIKVDNSGYRYTDNEVLSVYKQDNDTTRVATAIANATGVGLGQGIWKSKTSFLSEVTRAIHDNFYYQEYSFDVEASVPPRLYEDLVRDSVQVVGTKLFSTPTINTESQIPADADVFIEIFSFTGNRYVTEDGENQIIAEQSIDNEEAYLIASGFTGLESEIII